VTARLPASIALWESCETASPPESRAYTVDEQQRREAELARLIAAIQSELSRLPVTRSDRDGARERITAAFVRFGRNALDFEDRHLQLLLRDYGISSANIRFKNGTQRKGFTRAQFLDAWARYCPPTT